MIVKFLQYHNGKEVENRPAQVGDVREVADHFGELLVKNGWALEIMPGIELEPDPAPAPVRVVSKRVRRSK